MRAREVVRLLVQDGWYEVRQTGSHRHFKHPTKPGLVTIPDHGSKDLALRTVRSIERQSGLKIRPG